MKSKLLLTTVLLSASLLLASCGTLNDVKSEDLASVASSAGSWLRNGEPTYLNQSIHLPIGKQAIKDCVTPSKEFWESDIKSARFKLEQQKNEFVGSLVLRQTQKRIDNDSLFIQAWKDGRLPN